MLQAQDQIDSIDREEQLKNRLIMLCWDLTHFYLLIVDFDGFLQLINRAHLNNTTGNKTGWLQYYTSHANNRHVFVAIMKLLNEFYVLYQFRELIWQLSIMLH